MHNENNKDERIDQMKTELYSRKTGEIKTRRNNLSRLKKNKIVNTWGNVPKNDVNNEDLYKFSKRGPSVFSIVLIISLIFFVSAAAFAFFFLSFNKNEVKNDIIISVTGPNSIKSGESLDFLIKMENPTKLDYKDIEFFVEYPKSTVDTETKSFISNKTLAHSDPLLAGGTIGKKFSAILSGTAGDTKDIKITIFYKAGNFSNTLISKRLYTVEIDSAPVAIEMEYPKEVLSNKNFTFNVNVLSNTGETLKDLVIVGKYPSGFKLIKSEPEAVFSNQSQNVFKIEELKPGEKKSIQITSVLIGQNNEDKFFTFELGDSVPFRNEIRTLFSKIEEEISIKRPDIDLAIVTKFDNRKGEAIVLPDTTVDIKTILYNNLGSLMSDLKITAFLPEDLIVKKRVKAENGFYDSNENKVIWDKNTNPKMKSISGNDVLENILAIDLVEQKEIAGYVKNPEINIDFQVEGTNFNNQNSEGSILEKFTKNIKIPTEVFFKTSILHTEGPFENKGSMNPEVGKPSTYTVQWEVYNTSSDITDVEVRTKLPLYVKYLDNVSPKNSYVSYDEDKREVVWRYKKIEAFIGYRTDPKTVHFQVEYIPTEPQIEDRVAIIKEQTLSAKDSFVEREIKIILEEGKIAGIVQP